MNVTKIPSGEAVLIEAVVAYANQAPPNPDGLPQTEVGRVHRQFRELETNLIGPHFKHSAPTRQSVIDFLVEHRKLRSWLGGIVSRPKFDVARVRRVINAKLGVVDTRPVLDEDGLHILLDASGVTGCCTYAVALILDRSRKGKPIRKSLIRCEYCANYHITLKGRIRTAFCSKGCYSLDEKMNKVGIRVDRWRTAQKERLARRKGGLKAPLAKPRRKSLGIGGVVRQKR